MKSPVGTRPGTGVRGPRKATEVKRDHLLTRAAALFAEQGYEATSLRDVSQAVGVSLAGLYHYFTSKEDLLYQVQYRTFASLLQAQEEVAALPGTAEDRLRRLVIGHLGFFTRHPNELKACTYELESLKGDLYLTIEDLRRRYYHLFTMVVAELKHGSVSGAPETRKDRHATLFIFGMLNWIFMWYDPARHGPVEQIGEEMLDLMLNGLRPPRRPD
ncbi:MAG TPA: TetR/AcrR family transcriptional regulator [Gemmatimonadales bacterium]|nr:TetR/AcrR family transcriptional regulator [Gemmatimonadales bacterium]